MAKARVTYGDLTAEVTTGSSFPDAVDEVTTAAQRLFREALPYVAAAEAIDEPHDDKP